MGSLFSNHHMPLLAFSTESANHTHTQQAQEQVKTECTQDCEKWMGRNPIYKLKHGGLVGVVFFFFKNYFRFIYLLFFFPSSPQFATNSRIVQRGQINSPWRPKY